MPLTADSVALQAQLDARLQEVTDQQVRILVAAWVTAWAEVAADLEDTLFDILNAQSARLLGVLTGRVRISRATFSRSIRLRRALATIASHLADLAVDAGITLTRELADVVDTAAHAQLDILNSQFPNEPELHQLADHEWTHDDNDALEAIVRRTTEQIESVTDRLSAEAADAVRRELIRGIAVGSNPRETARRMVQRSEGRFNLGLTRALTLARTEMVDAHRAGAKVGQDRHAEVLQGWVWLCHFGPRTCPACLVRHGTVYSLETPGPDDHPQGRCSRMPKTKSWADLGIDLDEPADDLPDARAWFDALTDAEQIAILGRERLRMLRAGEISWDDLATVRKNSSWRDSLQVTPLRQLGQPSRGRAVS
jgi:F like protein